MIKYAEKEYSQLEIESALEGPVLDWFRSKYVSFTPPQKYAIVEISKKNNVLISSPTGSGKTLSAFLAIINELIKLGRADELEDKIYAVYVSPLKALNNDIMRNLEEPLREIKEVFDKKGAKMPEIRVAVRTGDTTTAQKSRMLKKPPHILVTTPESLAIVLNAPKFSEKLAGARYVIVDEIHALAENKRGVHLSLSLERLTELCKRDLIRIGLSATVHPIEDVAGFLVGPGRDCLVVDVNYLKSIKIYVSSPIDDLIYTPFEKSNDQLYGLLNQIISQSKATLVFTNTRSATERVVHFLKSKFGDKYIENIAAHHSSLSREHRLDVEEKLKRGELKVVVSSTSLELGIDIGNIDVVVLLGSPKSVSRALQRIGRSGHRLHDTSQGVILVLDRDDLVEDVVLAHSARNRKFDRLRIYKNAMDVLAQHIVGMGLEKVWKKDEALAVIRRSYCYSGLSSEDFESMLKYLSGNYAILEDKNVYGKIWYDGEEFGKRGRSVRAIYYMNIGTIPDEPKVSVFLDKKYLGGIEEGFAEKLFSGDVFVLGGKTYQFLSGSGTAIYVSPSESRRPTVPAWYSETLPLSYELALAIEKFRRVASKMEEAEISEKFGINEKTAKAVLGYLREQEKYSVIPAEDEFLVEEWKDDEGQFNYIFHSVCGRKANDAIARVFALEIGKKKGCNVATTISDYGFVLRVPRLKNITRLEMEELFWLEDFEPKLRQALEGTEMLRRRFRNVALRGYLVLKRYPGREMPISRQQINSEILLRLIKEELPDFPLLKEAYNEVMKEAMHVDEAEDYINRIRKRRLVIKSPVVPSPFAFNLVAMGAQDVVVIDDRREFIKKMHLRLLGSGM